jgi:hypothetical protein
VQLTQACHHPEVVRRFENQLEEEGMHLAAVTRWIKKALSDSERVKSVGTIITTVMVVAGGLAALQQADRWLVGNENEQYNRLSEKWLELDKFFFDHPDLREYFYAAGKQPASPLPAEGTTERSRVLGAAYYALDFVDYLLTALDMSLENRSSNLALHSKATWVAYFRNTLLASPAICFVYLQNPEAYGRTTREQASATCKAP